MLQKICTKCGEEKELNTGNFYPARPREGHKKEGWQSYCKTCWTDINKANKRKMADLKELGKNAATV